MNHWSCETEKKHMNQKEFGTEGCAMNHPLTETEC